MASELAAVGGGYTPEKIDLIKRSICQQATDLELALFIEQCKRTGLDPFAKQIHAVKRGGKMTIQVGIDGFRLIAQRTGQMDGQDGPYWCGEDGVWRDVWLDKRPPAACKVTVYRKGESRGYTGVARWSECYQQSGGMWDRLPTTMIAKVAESVALRKGFPQDLSGLYTTDEMGQADGEAGEAVPAPRPALPPKADPPPQRADAGQMAGVVAASQSAAELEAAAFAAKALYERQQLDKAGMGLVCDAVQSKLLHLVRDSKDGGQLGGVWQVYQKSLLALMNQNRRAAIQEAFDAKDAQLNPPGEAAEPEPADEVPADPYA